MGYYSGIQQWDTTMVTILAFNGGYDNGSKVVTTAAATAVLHPNWVCRERRHNSCFELFRQENKGQAGPLRAAAQAARLATRGRTVPEP